MICRFHGDGWTWPLDGRIFLIVRRTRLWFQVSFPSIRNLFFNFLLIIWTCQIECLLFFPFNTNHSFYWLNAFRLDFKRGYNLSEWIIWSLDRKRCGTIWWMIWNIHWDWCYNFIRGKNHSSFILKYPWFQGWYVEFSISDRLA